MRFFQNLLNFPFLRSKFHIYSHTALAFWGLLPSLRETSSSAQWRHFLSSKQLLCTCWFLSWLYYVLCTLLSNSAGENVWCWTTAAKLRMAAVRRDQKTQRSEPGAVRRADVATAAPKLANSEVFHRTTYWEQNFKYGTAVTLGTQTPGSFPLECDKFIIFPSSLVLIFTIIVMNIGTYCKDKHSSKTKWKTPPFPAKNHKIKSQSIHLTILKVLKKPHENQMYEDTCKLMDLSPH